MELIADGLLILGALVASLYCIVLSRRLRRLNQLDAGLGGAIAALSGQVDEMRGALNEAKLVTERSKRELDERTQRAEKAAGRLEILIAAVRDGKEAVTQAGLKPEDLPDLGGEMNATTVEDVVDDEQLSRAGAAWDASESTADGNISVRAMTPDEGPDADRQRHTDAETDETAAQIREDAADEELTLADAVSNPALLSDTATSGISKDLLSALEKMAGGSR